MAEYADWTISPFMKYTEFATLPTLGQCHEPLAHDLRPSRSKISGSPHAGTDRIGMLGAGCPEPTRAPVSNGHATCAWYGLSVIDERRCVANEVYPINRLSDPCAAAASYNLKADRGIVGMAATTTAGSKARSQI